MRLNTAVGVSVALTFSLGASAAPARVHHGSGRPPPDFSSTSICTASTVSPPDAPLPTFSTPPPAEPTLTVPEPTETEGPLPSSPEPTETETAAPVPPTTNVPLPPSQTEVPAPPVSTNSPTSTVTPAPTTDAPAPPSETGSPTPPPAGDCSCGYKLSAHGYAYFPKAFNADFGTIGLSGVAPSADWLSEYGIGITDGWQAGAVGADGTVPIGHFQNVRINNGTLELVVPAGQSAGGQTTNAQLEGPIAVNGVFTMDAKITSTPGTCQSIFTYHTQEVTGNDEQDVEILGSYLFEAGDNGTPPGIELTNYNPSGDGNDNTIVPFPADPTTAFHSYTIAWLQSGTQYLFDGTPLKGPSQFTSVSASSIVVNHWTNGDHGFTQGPPATDAVMQLQRFYGYYAPPGEAGLPAGCAETDVCAV